MQRCDQAWVTLATNDNYALGALVLGHSLRNANTTKSMHCFVTPSVSEEMRKNLDYVWDKVAEVNVMDSKDKKNLAMIKRPDLGVTFTKLYCWTLVEYKKCVFVDADCMVVQPCDELFEYPELSAAPDIGWPDIFNSGVFVYTPSMDTFDKLVKFAITEGSFDGGDQGLLNSYFSNWLAQGSTNRLPFIYNAASSTVYTYIAALKRFGKSIKIVHFLGAKKPWSLMMNQELAKAAAQDDGAETNFLAQWYRVLSDQVMTSLNQKFLHLSTPLSPPRLTSAAHESGQRTVHTVFSNLTPPASDTERQKAWEEGVVDYSGRDSWENIKSRLEETLSGKSCSDR